MAPEIDIFMQAMPVRFGAKPWVDERKSFSFFFLFMFEFSLPIL
jgi:hypothetical protein